MMLIITCKEDVHVSAVTKYLKDEEYFILYTEDIILNYDITWKIENGNIDFVIRDKLRGKDITGEKIKSVWLRRPKKPIIKETNNILIDEVSLNEITGFIDFLKSYLVNVFWITGHPHYELVAESKMLQIATALEVGFQTPKSIISNNGQEIQDYFIDTGVLAIKPIKHKFHAKTNQDDLDLIFYTKVLSKKELGSINIKRFENSFNFIQNYVDKKFELRITVIENKVMSCKIETQHLKNKHGKLDWRQGYGHDMRYEKYRLPKKIKDMCIEYLKALHLNFGCFDLIYTNSGEYIFLECNPNGQWLWIEENSGLQISKTIAESLRNKNKSKYNKDSVLYDSKK